MKESVLLKEFLVKYSKLGHRLFRQNVGTGYIGKILSRTSEQLTIKNPRILRAGLVKGSSDLIGWTNIKITPEMVGKTVPIFSAYEVKTGRIKVTKEQTAFVNYIKSVNGLAAIVYKFEDIEEELKKWITKNCM